MLRRVASVLLIKELVMMKWNAELSIPEEVCIQPMGVTMLFIIACVGI